MKQIRNSVFETNSSSVHTLSICSKKQFEEWQAGLIRYDPWNDTFSDNDIETLEQIKKDAVEHYKQYKECDPYTKKWDELDEGDRQRYIDLYVKQHLAEINEEKGMTWEYWRNYYHEYCEYSEKHYKTEHGDEIVAFGKGGYDG